MREFPELEIESLVRDAMAPGRSIEAAGLVYQIKKLCEDRRIQDRRIALSDNCDAILQIRHGNVGCDKPLFRVRTERTESEPNYFEDRRESIQRQSDQGVEVTIPSFELPSLGD